MDAKINKISFSIITCTFNPNREVFEKLIRSIANLELPIDTFLEWIIVDNNSTISVEANFNFSSVPIPISFISEKSQGLTNARIAGSKEASGDWLIFFDDDNEPSPEYLKNVLELIKNYENVKCWGAGKISVQFHPDKQNEWVYQYKNVFQERQIVGEIIVSEKKWNSNCPQGTGQVIEKRWMDDYIGKVNSGKYSLSDRKGKSMSSGGDVQIVLNIIKNNYEVGISSSLKLNHNIETSKSTFKYLIRLTYGMASGAVLAVHQVFPYPHPKNTITEKTVLKTIYFFVRQFKFGIFSRRNLVVLAQRLGNLNAHCLAFQKSKPKTLEVLERRVL